MTTGGFRGAARFWWRGVTLGLMAFLVLTTAACTHLGIISLTRPMDDAAETLELHEIQKTFAPVPGMTRRQVEAILGEPVHSGRTKEGLHLLQWRAEWELPREGRDPARMLHHQTIEFDDQWRVVRAYRPAGGGE